MVMNTWYLSSTLTRVSLGLALLVGVPAGWAADNFTATTSEVTFADKPAKTKRPKQAKAPKPPLSLGSSENKSERDRRMLRECRGKANAGACEGYAS
jgi:hypothetical protein